MKCNAVPFMGAENKVVMVHAKDDDAVVFPLIERLCKLGLRVWHDEEIRKTMIDYSRNWKVQQSEANCFLIFLSRNAINSHVFRERFTNAVETSKPMVIISTIANDCMSPGIKLQVSKAAEVIQSKYIPNEKLADDLINLKVFQPCKGAARPEIVVNPFPNTEDIHSKPPIEDSPRRNIAPSDRTVLELQREKESPSLTPLTADTTDANDETKVLEEPVLIVADSLDETIKLSNTIPNDDLEVTLVPKKVSLPVLVSFTSKEKMRGILGESMIGRTKKIQGSIADISFADQCRLFSGRHFQLIYIDEMCMLVCRHPNGMNVNGTDLNEGDKYTVESDALIQIPSMVTMTQVEGNDIHPAYIALVTGDKAQALWDASAVACLQSKTTGETHCFTSHFKFGREYAWETKVLASRNVSRNQGDIAFKEDHYYFEDHSTNGTKINGDKINNEIKDLMDGDVISVQIDDHNEEEFIFHCASSLKGVK